MTYETVDGCIAILDDTLRRICLAEVKTGLTTDILEIPSWSTVRDLAFLNLLCSYGDCTYLEYGSAYGRSLRAAASRNTGRFIGVDPFKAFDFVITDEDFSKLDALVVRNAMYKNIAGQSNIEFHEVDFHDFALPARVNVFQYDADHSREATSDGFVHAAAALNPAIVIVDDFSRPSAVEGTVDGIQRARLKIHKSWLLPREQGFHDLTFVAVVSATA